MATLGILITSERYVAYVSEIVQAARHKGYAIRLHLTGTGVRLCYNAAFATLNTWAEVTVCRHSAEQMGLADDLEKTFPSRLTAEKHMADLVLQSDRQLVL